MIVLTDRNVDHSRGFVCWTLAFLSFGESPLDSSLLFPLPHERKNVTRKQRKPNQTRDT